MLHYSYEILNLNKSESIGPNFEYITSKVPEKLIE